MQITRNPIRDDVQAALRQMISLGKLHPGQRLKEISLAQDLGVGRTPVREALLALEKDGYVVSVTNKGCSVVSITAARISEAYLMCGALEALAIKTTARFTPEHITELSELNQKIVNAKSRTVKYKYDAAWHETLCKRCGGDYLIDMLDKTRAYASCFDGAQRRGIVNADRTVEEHAAIIDALAAKKIKTAVRLVEEHWAGGVSTVVEWLAANNQIENYHANDEVPAQKELDCDLSN